MTLRIALVMLCIGTAACTPVRMVGDVAVTTGQIALGAADLVL